MRYGKSMSEALAEVREGFSKKEIKMAIGVASDPRYKQGNYSGAVRTIEKIKKGLSKHPQVAAVLKRQNEEIFEKVKCPHCEGDGCPKCEGNGYMADAVDKEDEPFLKDLIKNLRKGSATHSKQADDLEKAVKEETELDEIKEPFVVVDTADGDKIVGMASSEKGAKEIITTAQLPPMKIKDKKTLKIVKVKKKQMIGYPIKEETELDEKYDLYHKTFSDAMQHAYDYAKKKLGITVDPKEIDNKVATGPRKPSEGKTNKYRLKGKGGNLQIQVYNKGGSKPFELNMYKEEVELDEASIDMRDHDRTDPDFQALIKKLKLKAKDMRGDDGTTVTGNAKDIEKMLDTMYGDDWKDFYKQKGQKYLELGEEMRVFRVSSDKLQGNVHAKDEKEAEKIFRKKGAKGKITITDRGPKRHYRRAKHDYDIVKEGTWAVPETPAQKRDLKKLLSKPLALGKEGDNAADKMYSIIGDDELFDDLYVAGKKDPEGDARPIIKKAMKRLKIREDRWFNRDTWRLDESTKPDHIKVFNSLKKGDKVEINYDSSIAGGSTKTFVIKTKNKVYKGKVDKVTMYPDGKTGGVKFHLYQYDNRPGVYMAIGDMGASLRDIKKI